MLPRFQNRLVLCCLLLIHPALSAMQIGVAQVKITPPDGTPLSGYYSARGSTGVLDDIYAKAMVLDDGKTKAAIVVCDLLSLPRHTVLSARELIGEQTKVPPEHVLMGATHQHTGPVVSRESSRDTIDGGNSPAGQSYTDQLPKWIAQAVAEAERNLRSATFRVGRTEEHGIAFNRRFWMKDGSVSWNPPKNAPNIIRPAGPIDPEVLIFYAEENRLKPLLTYVNFAMHPDTTGGTMISADFPGALCRALALYKGADMLTIFANGCCGNINHRHISWTGNQTSPAEATRLGGVLAGNVLRAYPDLQPLATNKLRLKSELVKLPLAPITEEDVQSANAVLKRLDQTQTSFMEKVKAFQVLDIQERKGEPLEVEVQVIAWGQDLAFVSLPGEIFVELGLSIKKASPFAYTSLIELANGSIGYIPNKPAYLEGNYEVVSARCGAGSGELLVTAAVTMLEQLHREAAGN